MYNDDAKIRIITGDCREALKTLKEESVHCVITSPPYWGLRDYGIPPSVWGGDPKCEHIWGLTGKGHHPYQVKQTITNNDAVAKGQTAGSGQFCYHCNAWHGAHGLEPTIDLYVRNAVEIFRAVHRVLRPDGTLWLNLGDSYGGAKGDTRGTTLYRGKGRGFAAAAGGSCFSGTQSKQLCGIPWRVAFALQDDGWWLRQDIIWAKPNPMPESVTDRCTKSHEYLFLLTKSTRYFYDAEAIKESAATEPMARDKAAEGYTADYAKGDRFSKGARVYGADGTRNKRSVWTVATHPYPEAHFATFPPDLIEPCIKAGTSEKGCCGKCGAPWERLVEVESRPNAPPCNGKYDGVGKHRTVGGGVSNDARNRTERGWHPTCKCDAPITPCTVLDPFGGAGTTGLVSNQLGRSSILIELSPAYSKMASNRIFNKSPGLFKPDMTVSAV